MPSNLRLQSSFEPVEVDATFQTSPTFPPAKKQKMSLTNTYYVASTARSKLGREAGRPDHNLRLLVGHANLLDTLMVELADAEREQEAWFNQSIKKSSKPDQPRHIQWIDTIAESVEEDYESESDDGSDADDEDVEMTNAPLRQPASHPVTVSSSAIVDEDDSDIDSDDDAEYEDDEYDDELTLTRVASKHSPPELTHDSDSDSDDESMPPSPEQPVLQLSEKQRQVIATTSFYASKSHGGLDDYLTQQQHAPLIASY